MCGKLTLLNDWKSFVSTTTLKFCQDNESIPGDFKKQEVPPLPLFRDAGF